jgi:cyclohexanecarboxylate-CoA ligase
MMGSTIPLTFWELVTQAAKERPDAPVVSDDHGRSLTRAQLRDEAEATASALTARGVANDTVVSWQLPTTIEAVVLLVALSRIGAIQNPLIPILREREVAFITQQVGTELLIVPEEWRGFPHGTMARDLARTRDFDVLEIDLQGLSTHGSRHGLNLPTADQSGSALHPAPSTDSPRWIYYSSGTTADPKGARHTDLSVMASSNALLELMGFQENDVYPIPWPITHIGGVSVLTTSIRGGVHLILFEAFDAAETPRRMAIYRPTVLGTAVPFFRAYLDAERESQTESSVFPDLRFGTFGGAPVPSEVHLEMREAFGVPLVGSWGLTEFPNATSAAPDDPVAILTSTVGRPAPGVFVRAVDAQGVVCATGDEGELLLRGPQCFSGYVDPTLDKNSFDSEGWFHTGDLGTVDGAGNVRITGRLKDIIIRNAENISAAEVEEMLYRHSAVAEAAVLGVPDNRTGERVVAVVVPRDGCQVELNDIREHCRSEGLAIQKCPEQLEVVIALPRNAMGKVLKQELRSSLT